MRTDDLIGALADRLEPTSPRAPLREMTLWLLGGVTASVAAMLLWRGLRPDMMAAMATGMFWTKFAYTLAIGAAALWAAERLGRPGAKADRPARIVQSLIVGVVVLGAARYLTAAGDQRHLLLMGHSASLCPWNIFALSIPILIGAVMGLRRLAPTRPTVAGLAAGLAAGGLGAFVYSFSCNESAMPFVAAWYTLPVLASGALGALIGRYSLRW